MITIKNKAVFGFLPLIILALVILCGVPTCSQAGNILITIDTSPNVLNLNSNGTVVTVHTDIAYDEVEVDEDGNKIAELFFDYIPIPTSISISWWKMDNCGNFVAKFTMDEVKDLPLDIGNYNLFTLVGTTTSGDGFTGEQEVLVVNKGPVN